MGFGTDVLGESGKTACYSKAGLAEGTNANTIKTAAPNGAGIDYAIEGIAYHKADTDNIAMTAHAVQAVSTSCLYLVQINAAGTVSTKKGNEVLTADITAGRKNLQWPVPDADNCPIGAVRVDTNSSTTFTAGSTDLGAAGITDTYYDFIGGLPAYPITS